MARNRPAGHNRRNWAELGRTGVWSVTDPVASYGAAPLGDSSFTLDESLSAQRKAAKERRLYTVQVPVLRIAGFAVVCAIALLQDWRQDPGFPQPALLALVALNLSYAVIGWIMLRLGHGRSGRLDLGLLLFHLDVLVWLVNLHHLEQSHLFFAYFLLVRVADQVGFGFRRALYFGHLVTVAYLAYAGWLAWVDPARAFWADRLGIAAIIYLLSLYLALTGLVTERLRNRTRQAVRAAHALLDSLAQKADALQAQAAELDAARRQAEQAYAAKSQFLAMISHEIRTPMNGILGAAELLIGTPLTDAQRRYALTAHRSATALLALIDDVLDLSRIEAGKLVLHPGPVDLRALVAEAVDLVTLVARDKPVRLACSVAPELPAQVLADPLRLRQLLVNLLHNAVKFTDQGRIDLAVSVVDAAGAPRLRLSVRDTGIGIAADQLATIFDAFTQVDGSSTRRHRGSGLGLAIVKDLSDRMGGEVHVESQVGQGSHFWIDLPLIEADGGQAPAAPPPAEVDSLVISVLLAEDDVVNQMVAAEMLKVLGCEVDVVDDGDAACRAIAGQHYDIVFMDCHMPVMDGYEATRRVRAQGRRNDRHLPIVALTADSLAADRQRCLDAGMDDFLTKPVSTSQLSAVIERWTGRRTHPATVW